MGIKYRAITANCGNDAIGKVASESIAVLLHEEDADFYVINCQEVAFYKTQRQLQAAVGNDYSVVLVDKMATHTKLSTQFNSNTGIASYIIHKKSYDVAFSSSQAVRRSNNRVGGGSGFNKGGLITELTLKERDSEELIKIQAISGHLDSNNMVKRCKDWQNINQKMTKDASNWSDLVSVFSHIILSGYDANTRNKINNDKVVNLWSESPNEPEIQALYQASLGGQNYSKESTYKTDKLHISHVPDDKRRGYARGGMLDFVAIADGSISGFDISQEDVVQIGIEEGTERDHDIVISPLRQYTKLSDFNLVKNQMAARLIRVAPDLATEIFEWPDSENTRAALVHVYERLLSPNGLLNNAIELHTKKLRCMSQLTEQSFLNSPLTKSTITTTLFPPTPWFESINLDNMDNYDEKYHQKQSLMNLLLTSLTECQNEAGLQKRLDWYNTLSLDITAGTYEHDKAVKSFHDWGLQEYRDNCKAYLQSLNNYQPSTPNERLFIKKGMQTYAQISKFAEHELTDKNPDFTNLAQLNMVLEQCKKAVDTAKDGGDVLPISKQLAHLSEEVSGKSSQRWKALGAGLFLFAGMALVVAGVLAAIPTGGTGLLFTALGTGAIAAGAGVAGFGIFTHKSEKGLAKSVTNYKQALNEIAPDENTNTFDTRSNKGG